MSEFFQFPLRSFYALERRPKMGLAALILALASMAAWTRSVGMEDQISFSFFGRLQVFNSAFGSIRWAGWDDHGWVESIEWRTATIRTKKSEWDSTLLEFRLSEAENNATFWGFKFRQDLEIWAFDYWEIIGLFTLVSTYLLLGKPRRLSPKRIAERISDEELSELANLEQPGLAAE